MERTNDKERSWRGGQSGVKYLGRGPKVDWGLVKFLAGETLGAHYHRAVEETFYFPDAAPLMVIDGQEMRVTPGDAFRLEPGETHNIINDTNGPVTAVFIKCPFDPDDKVPV